MNDFGAQALTDLVYLPVQIQMALENTDKEIFRELQLLVGEEKKRIVIIPHANPDGDAIGSAIGLAEVFSSYGHTTSILSPNDYPEFLKWFASDIEIVIAEKKKDRTNKLLAEAEVMFCLDFNDVKRSGGLKEKLESFEGKKVLIDHHPFPTQFCDLTISETSYSSTAELIYDVLGRTKLQKHLTQNAAEALYTGILTDTGSFSHNTSRPNTFKVVSELMHYGIDTDKIQSGVFHNFSANRMRLLGHCLNERMEVFPEYRSALIYITKEDLERFEFQPGDSEGFVNYPLSIKDIVFTAIFIEKDGYVKASFRSKGDFPTNLVASTYFNGGGHLNASGGESELNLDSTLEKFKGLLPEFKQKLLGTII